MKPTITAPLWRNNLIYSDRKRQSREREDKTCQVISIFCKPDYHSSAKETITTALFNGSCDGDKFRTLTGKAGCRLLSIFSLCEASKRKMEQLEGRLHYLESRMIHLHNEERQSIHVMASSSMKLLEDTQKVLNYSEDNFEILETNLEVLQKTMEKIQQTQACDHRGSDISCMTFAPKVRFTTYHGLSLLCKTSCNHNHYIWRNRETYLLQALECYPREYCQPH